MLPENILTNKLRTLLLRGNRQHSDTFPEFLGYFCISFHFNIPLFEILWPRWSELAKKTFSSCYGGSRPETKNKNLL